jgi:hypothetical protein
MMTFIPPRLRKPAVYAPAGQPRGWCAEARCGGLRSYP